MTDNIYIDIETLPPFPKDEMIVKIREDLLAGKIKLKTKKRKEESILDELIAKANDPVFVKKQWEQMSLNINYAEIFCIVIIANDKESYFMGPQLLIDFAAYINENIIGRPTFVGFNIKDFDMPIIYRRLVKHAISCPYFPIPSSGGYKYHRDIKDLCELWPSENWKDSQASICKELGIVDEFPEGSGRDVLRWYLADQQDNILKHCISDVRQLVKLHQRLSLLPEACHDQ